MTKAVVVSFHQYFPRVNDHYRVFSQMWYACFKKWEHLVDKVYLIDHGWGFDAERLSSKFIVLDIHESHWDNFNAVIPVVEEDLIIMMDSDMLIYDPAWMEEILKQDFDVATITDSSGSSIADKYPFMAANENRAERKRFAPYLCMVKKETMEKTEMYFSPDYTPDKWTDSFGTWTQEVLALNPKILEIPDDRFTIRISKKGGTTKDSWLDGAPYKWSIPLDQPKNYGYYHIRNWNGGLRLVNLFHEEKDNFDKDWAITPFEEAMRMCAWLQIATEKYNPKFLPRLHDMITSYKMPIEVFTDYVNEFYEAHPWLKEL